MISAGEELPSFAASVHSSELPGYDGRRPPTHTLSERQYTLESGGKPWAFLKVFCRPGSATSIPSFIEGEPITGTVELHLAKTEHIQAVTIEARGESLSVGQDPIPFLAQESTLRSTSTENTGSIPSSPKLKGDYVWPFCIVLPNKVTASIVAKGPASLYSLPPSFSERASPAYLEYKLVVTFRRGRLRVDNTLSTSFAFLPRSATPASSLLRQLAYREDGAPPGPKSDPEGWESLGKKSVTGTIFDTRQVEMSCSMDLAKPLCYTRGTFIPFFLTLSCPDLQALDLFAAHGSLTISLVRALNVGSNATDEHKARRSDNSFLTSVGKGVYWSSSESNAVSEVRTLEGEIPVKRDLKPSCIFPRLCIKYHVSFALTATSFVPISDGSLEPLFSHEVLITTDTAPGPVPRSRMPPALEERATVNNYDVSIGLLTAANQRYVHHHAFS